MPLPQHLTGVILMALALAFPRPAKGQPAPDGPDRPVEEVEKFREAAKGFADQYEMNVRALRWGSGRIAQLETENNALAREVERLGAQAWQPWTPATVMAPGGTYKLPDNTPVNVVVDQDHVTVIVGDGTYATPGVNRPAIDLRANYGTVRGGRFSAPATIGTGAGRLGVKPCIDIGTETARPDRAYPVYRGNRIIGVTFDRVDVGVRALPGCEGLLLDSCRSTDDMRAGGVFVGGGNGVTLNRCRFSATVENTVRWSPQNDIVPERATIIDCEILNLGSKAAVELRHVKGAVVKDSRLVARAAVLGPDGKKIVTERGSGIGIGDKDSSDGDHGAVNVYIANCDIVGGNIRIHEGADRVFLDDVRMTWTDKATDPAIYAVTSAGVIKELTVTNVRATSAAAQTAPVLVFDRPRIPGTDRFAPPTIPPMLVDRGNSWTVTPAATQPSN